MILGGPTGFRAINETTQNALSFLSITTVIFHRSHYTTMSKVGMHKNKIKLKKYGKHVSICFTMLCVLCYGWFVPGAKKKSHVCSYSAFHVELT